MEITIDRIQTKVEEYFKMSPGSLSIPTNKLEIVRARQKAMYLCKEFNVGSNEEIGLRLAGRDRTSVNAAIKKVLNLKNIYKNENNEICELKKIIETPEESWKDIPGFEGYYQASTLKKVRSVTRIVTRGNNTQYQKECEKKPYKGRVNLHKEDRITHWSIDRIMLMTFGVVNPS